MNILIGLINGMIAGATPIMLGALGGSFTFYAGVFNIAMEGMMLTGAFCAVWGSYTFHNWFIGILCGITGSLILALIFILFAIVLKTDEFVTGIALNLFAAGATVYMLRQTFQVKGAFSNPGIIPVPQIHIPLIEKIPILGEILSGQNLIVYIAALSVWICYWLVFRTRFGLRLRAATEGHGPDHGGHSGHEAAAELRTGCSHDELLKVSLRVWRDATLAMVVPTPPSLYP